MVMYLRATSNVNATLHQMGMYAMYNTDGSYSGGQAFIQGIYVCAMCCYVRYLIFVHSHPRPSHCHAKHEPTMTSRTQQDQARNTLHSASDASSHHVIVIYISLIVPIIQRAGARATSNAIPTSQSINTKYLAS